MEVAWGKSIFRGIGGFSDINISLREGDLDAGISQGFINGGVQGVDDNPSLGGILDPSQHLKIQ